jgi:hypothetical protein
MKLVGIRSRVILLCIVFVLSCLHAESSAVWYQKGVTWSYGIEGRLWETAVVSPDGKEHYRLALIPLWAVEGGIIAMEILVAHPEHPDDNLLGERDNHPQPFVVGVEELRRGINRSRFGATRVFNLDEAKLRVKIKGARLGNGVGSGSTYCRDCKNIQEFTAEFSFEGK